MMAQCLGALADELHQPFRVAVDNRVTVQQSDSGPAIKRRVPLAEIPWH